MELAPYIRSLSDTIFTSRVTAIGVRLLKYVLVAIILANARSWPFMWHIRVFHPVTMIRLRFQLLRLSLIFKPRKVRQEIKANWLHDLSPVGKHPLELTDSYKTWASLDDCDFNLHLSNSCYAKIMDAARFQAALKCFPTFFRAGGWMALAGTHYNFLREIPMLSPYEVRVTMGAWDQKWVYIIVRYVSHPKKKAKTAASKGEAEQSKATPSPPSTDTKSLPTPPENNILAGFAPYPILHTPSVPEASDSRATTEAAPTPANPVGVPTKEDGSQGQADALSAALKKQMQHHTEPDGATLHCIAVSTLCFKIGRITVPPALALASEGFCSPDLEGEPKTYSLESPPPFWKHVEELRGPGLSLGRLRRFLTGGWREVPEGERWWEEALKGEVERRRVAALEVLGSLRTAMDGAQKL
ncbi:uncharacterized protein LAESUDRAFT_727305 [Laetiporus sulphureus 93-53]|uniref:Thioesterase/thiol ester dehydrase-isomerase n=1 Tax=Laetiporus sulphureus 93-53 TaxID=1314785 RepID=A0A165DJZ1_9APHY|nr:uncharacterized protein LAESUDRAFT_727305 [Laetiporus sulphureus 93-53]KZT05050.1 hypothetical protein LAESUDRAFT_727305 [Laetiporus sulphureus 93-53]